MPKIAPEPVQPPAHYDVEFPAFGIFEEGIEPRAPVLGAADAPVHELRPGPAPGLDVAPEFLELILRLLVEGADAGVDCGLHNLPPVRALMNACTSSNTTP